jgi:site-specific DNA recombinase
MMAFLRETPSCRTILVEKTDRLYRNFRDYGTAEDLGATIHFVKENTVLSGHRDQRRKDFRTREKGRDSLQIAESE